VPLLPYGEARFSAPAPMTSLEELQQLLKRGAKVGTHWSESGVGNGDNHLCRPAVKRQSHLG
jgi:hypothetical protein